MARQAACRVEGELRIRLRRNEDQAEECAGFDAS